MFRKLILFGALLIAGCGNVQPQVNTDVPDVVTVGEQVTLDASKTVYDRDSTYTWNIDKAPYGSAAAIDNPHAKKTTFTPDLVGQYQFTVTVANKDFSDSETVTLTVIPELADGVTEVGVLVIHSQDTILGWQIGHTVDEAGDIIALEYPSLVDGWGDGSVLADVINVPIDNLSHPELYQVVDGEVGLKPTE